MTLYYDILYCTILYCTILYYTILYYTTHPKEAQELIGAKGSAPELAEVNILLGNTTDESRENPLESDNPLEHALAQVPLPRPLGARWEPGAGRRPGMFL